MGRFVSGTSLVCVLAGCALLLSCGGGSVTRVTPNQVPAAVALSPAGNIGVEVGKTLNLGASATNSAGTQITETFTFQSSNPSAVTVAVNGSACAGTWDSLTSPSVCTPGSTGVAQVTATANGVLSPPVTIYVHQHITHVVIQPLPNQPPTLSSTCLSRSGPAGLPESLIYEALAYSGTSGTNDITQSVGPFNWGAANVSGQASSSSSVVLASAGTGAPLNQRMATASIPGTTSIFATTGGVTSQPLPFTTCPVQSISLNVAGSSPSTTSFLLGPPATLNATVIDSIGRALTGVPLTWVSSNPQSVSVTGGTSTVYASVGTVIASSRGSAAVTASCTPPNCNGGITPSLPIYPTNPLNFQATAAPTTSSTTYVTTSACSVTTQACITRLIPLTASGTTSVFSAGNPVNLPFTPNSFLFGRSASNAMYLGVDDDAFGAKGLMVFSGSSVSSLNGAAGRVLVVSPDAATVILSDTVDSPSRVNICKNCSGAGRTLVPILLPNAKAAAFSPDGLKAYIVSDFDPISGMSCPGSSAPGCLMVYSQVDAPQFLSLPAAATDAEFIGNGSAGYTADTTLTSSLSTCGPSAAGFLGNVGLPAQMLLALPDGLSLLALSPPDVQLVTASLTGSGCQSPRGSLTITNTVGPSFNLGVGSFTPTQFFLSASGDVAYILGRSAVGSTTAPLPFIISFNIANGTTSLISLAGNAVPLSAALNRSGHLLVGANDESVHVIDTSTGLDIQQVALNFPQFSLCVAPGNPATQVTFASLTLSAAQQNSTTSSTTFAYSLVNGSTPQPGQSVVVAGMSDAGNNGRFTITAVNPATSSTGTITVANAAGVTATGQNGTGTVPLTCNADLIATGR